MVLSNESLGSLTSSLCSLMSSFAQWHSEQPEEITDESVESVRQERRRREAEIGRRIVEIHSRLKTNDEEASSSNETHSPKLPMPDEYDELARGGGAILRLPCSNAMLQSGHSLHTLAAQMLAEVAKDAIGRKVCVDAQIVEAVNVALQKLQEQQGGMDAVVEMCRVLGNVCCDCEPGRQQVLSTGCLQALHKIALDEGRIKKEKGQRFPVVLAGLLLNFCNSFGPGVDHVGQLGLVDVIMKNVLATTTNDAVFNASLNFLVVAVEEKEGHTYLKKSDTLFPKALVHILEHTTGPEVTETALELLRLLVDDVDQAVLLAGSPLCSSILKLVEGRWATTEFGKLRLDACDSIIVMLSHDEAMRALHKFDQGNVFNTFTRWLDHKEPRLRLVACQAIANFACEADHRSRILDEGASSKLIDIVQQGNIRDKYPKVLTAALGGIHNLAVEKDSRLILLKQNVLAPLTGLCDKFVHTASNSAETEAIVFKLYSDVRLLVDETSSDSARSVAAHRAAMANIITWGQMGSQRVKAEATRLIAAVIKHAKSAETNGLIVELGGMPLLTTMLMSGHTRMLNEALIAVTLMAATLKAEDTKAQLHTDLVVNAITKCLSVEGERPKELMSNALSLTKTLLQADPSGFKAMLKEMKFDETLGLEHVQALPEFSGLQRALKGEESQA